MSVGSIPTFGTTVELYSDALYILIVSTKHYSFIAPIWIYPGEAAWHFITLPKEISDEIKMISEPKRRGFGSVRVGVKIQESEWKTSIFPDSKSQSYVLPVKKEVRSKNKLEPGVPISIEIRLVDF